MIHSTRTPQILASDPHWFKQAIIYEIPVRAFADSNNDGIGDFPGLIDKLDYLQDLGVTAVWLLPFYPSPLRDGGYDTSDYTSVHPMYGSLQDFKRFLKEAHARGIRVITELVINHTSKEHPWFQRARSSKPKSKWRDFYVWSDSPERYSEARIIFKDFESSNWTWDPEAKAYYWHRFYSHQPDLNFDNPAVHAAVFKVLDFWFDMGVDGLRLDAVPYLYERDGTNCENLPPTHAFLKKLRAHVDRKYKDRMLLAEANQWPEDAAAYFGEGDECHMNFHFPLMPRMFMAVQLEDRFPIVDILNQTPEIPENCQWAIFLRNHDELTLEMVTDEDRDYMYKVYAEEPTARINLGIRRRLAPLLKDRAKIELANGLLFSLPGTPVLYYGDELGMGDNIYLGDRDGVRTPMQWNANRNGGFSDANPQKLYLPIIIDPEYHYEAINVESQQSNSASLLWWMKRTIGYRQQYEALGSGDLKFVLPDNPKVLAFVRQTKAQSVLVVANLSRSHQWTELDLAEFAGSVPVELSGSVRFPPITEHKYFLSLSPYGFLWFVLEKDQELAEHVEHAPKISVTSSWHELLNLEKHHKPFEKVLLRFCLDRRWFRSKARRVKGAKLDCVLPLRHADDNLRLALLQVNFQEGEAETYLIPLAFHRHGEAEILSDQYPNAVIAEVKSQTKDGDQGCLFDGFACGSALLPLLHTVLKGGVNNKKEQRSKHERKLSAWSSSASKNINLAEVASPKLAELEQSNSVVNFGDQLLLKLFRRVEPGINSELEVGAFLTSKARLECTPRVLAALNLSDPDGVPLTLAMAQEYVPNQGSAWELVTSRIKASFEAVLTEPTEAPRLQGGSLVEQTREEWSLEMRDRFGMLRSQLQMLGVRTGEMHLALASRSDDPDFAPERFTTLQQQSIYQMARTSLVKTFDTLRKKVRTLPAETRELAQEALLHQVDLDRRLRGLTKRKLDLMRIRCHGDYHLGQVLHTGDNFVIIDFEGEPARPLNERRYKRGPLRDVMGMIRSFSYAAEAALRTGPFRPHDREVLRPWAQSWLEHATAAYLGAYLDSVEGAAFIPKKEEHTSLLLSFYELEKIIYEIGYELNNRPDWLDIPLLGLHDILAREEDL